MGNLLPVTRQDFEVTSRKIGRTGRAGKILGRVPIGKGSGLGVVDSVWIFTYKQVPWHSAKVMRRAMKFINARVAKFWLKKRFPRHFIEGQSPREYHYQRRKRSTIERKRENFGHNKPLIKTGTMRQWLERTAQIKANSKGARVRMRTLPYLHFRGKTGKDPDKAAEVSEMSNKDARAMAREVQRHVNKTMNKRRPKRVTVIRG